jgi:hypothetical protein
LPWSALPYTAHEGQQFGDSNQVFNIYNILLVAKKPYDLHNSAAETMRLWERFGVGVLHIKALQWALNPGPPKEDLSLT